MRHLAALAAAVLLTGLTNAAGAQATVRPDTQQTIIVVMPFKFAAPLPHQPRVAPP
jgi:hypothetical protein